MINPLPQTLPVPASGPIDTSPISAADPAPSDLNALWRAVTPALRTRSNDVHVPISMAYADRLCVAHPQANALVVRVAVLLHDTGWSRVDEDRIILEGFGPGGMTSAVRFEHEAAGCQIAREVLPGLGHGEEFIDAVCAIIDGHDTRPDPLSLEDALMKDADRLWRFDRAGAALASGWLGITPAAYLDRLAAEIPQLLTAAGLAIGTADLARTRALLLADVLR
ncbi:MAG: HD domain-containing protein [Brooklawnia sp.]|jgi:hypothetical protein